MLAAYGDVKLRRDGLAAKEVARRRELAAAFAHKQKLEVDRMLYCLNSETKRPSVRRRQAKELCEEEEMVNGRIRYLEELGERYRQELVQRGDLSLSVVDADGGAPVSAGVAALEAEDEAKILEPAKPGVPMISVPGSKLSQIGNGEAILAHDAPLIAGPASKAIRSDNTEVKHEPAVRINEEFSHEQGGCSDGSDVGYVLMEVDGKLPNAVRQFQFMRDEAPTTNDGCIAEATKVLTLLTGVYPAPSNTQLAMLAPPEALSAAEAAVFHVEPNIAMLNTYLSTLLKRSPPRADAHLPAAALEVFSGLRERYAVEPNGHTYALMINQLTTDVRGDPDLCRDFPGREETLHIDKARLEEALRLFEEWKKQHMEKAANKALELEMEDSSLSVEAPRDGAAGVATIPADKVEVSFRKEEDGVTDLVFFNVHRDVCNALARCDRVKESLKLATELRDQHKYTLNIRDFKDVYRACKRTDDGPSMLRILDLCPPWAHSAVERAKTVLGKRWHGAPNNLQYYIGRKKRKNTCNRIVQQEEETMWMQERLEFIRKNVEGKSKEIPS